MTITMKNSTPNLSEIKSFLSSSDSIQFKSKDRAERNEWIQKVIMKHKYLKCSKKIKSLLRKYIIKMTSISKPQLTRLIKKYKTEGTLKPKHYERNSFSVVYTKSDVELLASVDNAHDCLSAPATIRIMKSEYDDHSKNNFERLKNISVSHLYRLRSTDRYRFKAKTFSKTNPTKVNIGDRCKPEPNGKPGFLCVDTVHQGDKDKEKGVYHVNIVDMVTQFEFIGSVKAISQNFMKKILADLIAQFPFQIIEFHADNGSEYINHTIAKLLNNLLIDLTRSRPRKSNDNALIESKNGAIIRKHMGYVHIPSKKADQVNKFYQEHFNTYLNYYRPCAFPEIKIDKKGKERKYYPHDNYMTPYEKLKSIPNVEKYLKPTTDFKKIDVEISKISPTDYAKKMQSEKYKLFKNILK